MTGVDPRTGLEEIDENECWRLLGLCRVGRLAVVDGHQPDIFPVNFVMDGHDIVLRTGPGTKLAAAVINGLAAFEVDVLDPEMHTGWSVVVHGSVVEIDDLEGVLAAEDLEIQPWADTGKSRFVRITASAVTGRRIPTPR